MRMRSEAMMTKKFSSQMILTKKSLGPMKTALPRPLREAPSYP